MTEYVFAPAPVMGVPVVGSDRLYPVRRIYCVGRNYLDHIREMGQDERQPPFFFQKPTDAIVQDGATIPYPVATQDYQFEIELVLAIGKGGADIAVEQAGTHVFGAAVGIDFTRRDLQLRARDTGRPWEAGKSFDQSAPIAAIVPIAEGRLPEAGAITLDVNGEQRQSGDLAQLIWNCAEIVAQLSRHYRLEPGDLIYTGTPAGVGPVVAGDRIVGRIEGLPSLHLTIA
ncbi:FAA hydrolase family protein [Novosphingobium umbonatum]|uniref:FAA hydrolase family protein n=1 Tax=Novosphingobium umbonatum TaxID=1908524 RepID=A0A437MX81_9SPHN|nr:fumarylacetoacetate hydrolase family protein [Novosphingobium umbonatum]RVU02285.1 FAA hydrolase family protein [Novosphingobium umbonatum]